MREIVKRETIEISIAVGRSACGFNAGVHSGQASQHQFGLRGERLEEGGVGFRGRVFIDSGWHVRAGLRRAARSHHG